MTNDRLLVIVEDDTAFARTLKRSFERREYNVVLASGLEELRDILQTQSPHYAIVDLNLSGASGLT